MPNTIGPVSVPQDTITQAAYALINEVAAGGDGQTTLGALDAATKAQVCQRAMDLLALIPCSGASGSTVFTAAKGTCVDDSQNPGAFQNLYTTLYPGVIKACQTAGVTVQEEMPLVVGEAGIGLVLGAVAGGFLGHHYGHAVIGVIGGAVAGLFGAILVYDLQASRVPAPAAPATPAAPAATGWY